MKFLPLTIAALSIGSANAIGGTICDPILTTIASAFDAALPINTKPDCECDAKADSFLDWLTLQFYFQVNCSAKLCVDDLKDVPGMADVVDNLPLAAGFCMRPTGGANVNPIFRRESFACSGAGTLVLDVPKLEEMTKQEISSDPTITFTIPDTCLLLELKATLTEIKSCEASIDGQDCPCAVCADGTGIQLNCPTTIQQHIPDQLDSVVGQTTNCISANMLAKGGTPANPFLALLEVIKPNANP